MTIDIESLELATLDAVAPTAIDTMPGWLLPFDTTTVGRAISAVPVRHQDVDPGLVPEIIARYAERGLSTQFRIAEVPGTSALRQALLHLGYLPHQPTLTMIGSTSHWPTNPRQPVQLSEQATPAWQAVYLSGDFDPLDGSNRVRALSRSKCLVYAWIEDASGGIAAGTAAFSRGWVSLHGLRTVARERGKGCARDLIAALGEEASARHVDRCFLQVEARNEPAIRLYRTLGFQAAWLYHYWREVKGCA